MFICKNTLYLICFFDSCYVQPEVMPELMQNIHIFMLLIGGQNCFVGLKKLTHPSGKNVELVM